MNSGAAREDNMAPYFYAVYLLRSACSSVLIDQKMQLTGWDNCNDVRNTTCGQLQTSKGPTRVALLSILYTVLYI